MCRYLSLLVWVALFRRPHNLRSAEGPYFGLVKGGIEVVYVGLKMSGAYYERIACLFRWKASIRQCNFEIWRDDGPSTCLLSDAFVYGRVTTVKRWSVLSLLQMWKKVF